MFVFNVKFWKSVVGKLWATIIGLVALVLLINSLLLGRFIDSNLISPKDQENNLLATALQVSQQITAHRDVTNYLGLVNEILHAQEAGLILLDAELKPVGGASAPPEFPVDRIFSRDAFLRVLAGEPQGPALFEAVPGGREYLAWAVPVRMNAPDDVGGIAVVYQKKIELNYIQQYYTKLFAVAIVIGFLLTTFFAFFLSTRITQPLLQLKRGTDAITRGEYTTRVPVPSSDEIGELAIAYNHMVEWLERTIRDLQHEKELMSGILRSMTDAVITLDAEGRVILANPHGEAIIREWNALNWEAGEASNGAADASGAGRSDEAPAPERFEQERDRRVPEPLEALFRTAVGESREVYSKLHVKNRVFSVVIAPLYGDSGESARGAVAVLRDVTEEFRLDKLRKDFVANVSHELRTPLSMLQGYSEALVDDIAASPEERREIAQIIHDESVRMGRLVRDLLDLARMEAGHMEFRFGPTNVRGLLERMYRKFAVYTKENGVALELNLPDGPLELAHADEDRLEQVFTNLLDNALRHTPAGKRIEIRAERTDTAFGPALRVSIADEGQGIPAEDLPFIFERFYKADKARTRGATGGTGLGLAIVRQIVNAHGGHVDVDSAPGRDTTFSVLLPVDRDRS